MFTHECGFELHFDVQYLRIGNVYSFLCSMYYFAKVLSRPHKIVSFKIIIFFFLTI